MRKDEMVLKGQMCAIENNIESFNDAHEALEEMFTMAERRVEWNITDFTSLETGLRIRNILSKAIVEAKEELNASFRNQFNLEE